MAVALSGVIAKRRYTLFLQFRYGASQADYYSEIIGLALQRKVYTAKKPGRRFRAALD